MTTKQAILSTFETYRAKASWQRQYIISFWISDENGINEFVSLDHMGADAATYAIVMDNHPDNVLTLSEISPM